MSVTPSESVSLKSLYEIFKFISQYNHNPSLKKILLQIRRLSPEGIFVDVFRNYPCPEINTEMEVLDYPELKDKAINNKKLDFFITCPINLKEPFVRNKIISFAWVDFIINDDNYGPYRDLVGKNK